MAFRASTAPVAANAQHEPQRFWSLMGVMYALQSRLGLPAGAPTERDAVGDSVMDRVREMVGVMERVKL
jgi:hypothetical protein